MKQILIDNGHGIETPGKRSPDGTLLEYAYNRKIARAVVEHLSLRGYDAKLLVPEETDISLEERVRRANRLTCRIGHPDQDTILISIHVNAAGNGKLWESARGWCAYTYRGHSQSDEVADALYRAAWNYLPGHRIRTDYSDGDPDFEAPFYILKYTYCAAVLTENLFMDNLKDHRFLMSDYGQKAIVDLHVAGIVDYLSNCEY